MDERSVAAYEYELPPALIAQEPTARRDAARLLAIGADGHLEDRTFTDLPTLLHAGDLLVLNETRVIRARLFARRESGGRVEVLLLHPAGGHSYDPTATTWTALVRPGKRVREGTRLEFIDRDGGNAGTGIVTHARAEGARDVRFDVEVPFERFLERAGCTPLPPYIHTPPDEAEASYQTVFARVPGSIAAPTAGLHFTAEVFRALDEAGIEIAKLALDVGVGTFRPMQGDRIDEHTMHSEHYTLSHETVECIERARRDGRRVVAVGTTVVRALEGNLAAHGTLVPGAFETSLFITPGFDFRVVDAMVTNFHLPGSTLLVLVSAFAGRERVLHAYREAIARGYRFFSFGDAMLVERT